MGSVASNTIFPGGSGQEPHIDYPYWDYFKSENWPAEPKHKDIPFFMNLQVWCIYRVSHVLEDWVLLTWIWNVPPPCLGSR